MAFTVLNLPVLPSYSPNQNKNIAAEISREPRYGEDGAVLHNFRQKHQPHRPLVKAIGDDKEVSMHTFISERPYKQRRLSDNGTLCCVGRELVEPGPRATPGSK